MKLTKNRLEHMDENFIEENYELLTPINFFGEFIPAGTQYIQRNADEWQPFVNGALCPSFQIDFMIVRNNPTYFKAIGPKYFNTETAPK